MHFYFIYLHFIPIHSRSNLGAYMLLIDKPERCGYRKLLSDQLVQKHDLKEIPSGDFIEVSLEQVGQQVGAQTVYRIAPKPPVY